MLLFPTMPNGSTIMISDRQQNADRQTASNICTIALVQMLSRRQTPYIY